MGPTKPPTKIEQGRMDKLRALPCPFCEEIGIWNYSWIEIHHLLAGNKRMGHLFTINPCAGHHRGIWSLPQQRILEPSFRVAISDGRKAFTKVYSTEKETWVRIQHENGWDASWPSTKIVARKSA